MRGYAANLWIGPARLPHEQWGRQCVSRRAPSAGLPRRRAHWSVSVGGYRTNANGIDINRNARRVGAVASARRAGRPQRGYRGVACTGARYLAGRWRARRSASVVSTAASARGAVAARPVARLSPRRPRCASISARDKGFVSKSAGFSVPRTLNKRQALVRTRSWT